MTTRRPSWKTVAKRLLGTKAVQNIGDGSHGPVALVTPCRGVDFSLWAMREGAEKFKVRLDRSGCCDGCEPERHYLIDLAKSGDRAVGR